MLTRDQLRALFPMVRTDAIGAIHYTDEAIVDPAQPDDRPSRRLPCAWRVHRRTIAAFDPRFSADATRVRLATSPRAPFAVLAAGAWTSEIAVTIEDQPYALPRSFPMKGHLLGYRLPAGSLAATVRHDHTYVLQRADGFTIAGSSTEDAGFDRTIDPKIVSEIAARAAALVPALASLKPESVWIGFRPATDAAAPHIGRVSLQPPVARLRPLSQRHLARPRHVRSRLPEISRAALE